MIEEKSKKSRDNFLYDYRHASNRFWQEFEIFDENSSRNRFISSSSNTLLQNSQNQFDTNEENSFESLDDLLYDNEHMTNSKLLDLNDLNELYTNNELFLNKFFAIDSQIANSSNSNNANSNSQNIIENISNDELAIIVSHENYNDFVTYNQVMTNLNANKWRKAMNIEINDLLTQNTWNLVKSSIDAYIIDERWIYKIKLNSDDTINKYKVKYVAKEFQQKYDIDFEEIFSNTIKSMMFRLLFALVAWNDLKIQQLDINSIFSNVKLESHIKTYMKQSKDYEKDTKLVFLLNKTLYDLKQSTKQCYLFLVDLLSYFDFNRLQQINRYSIIRISK